MVVTPHECVGPAEIDDGTIAPSVVRQVSPVPAGTSAPTWSMPERYAAIAKTTPRTTKRRPIWRVDAVPGLVRIVIRS